MSVPAVLISEQIEKYRFVLLVLFWVFDYPPERELDVRDFFNSTVLPALGKRDPVFNVATVDLLEKNADPSDSEIREALAGNLCRCTGYSKILDAVRLAAVRLEGAGKH